MGEGKGDEGERWQLKGKKGGAKVAEMKRGGEEETGNSWRERWKKRAAIRVKLKLP